MAGDISLVVPHTEYIEGRIDQFQVDIFRSKHGKG